MTLKDNIENEQSNETALSEMEMLQTVSRTFKIEMLQYNCAAMIGNMRTYIVSF
jgi:hypothetical protein